MQCMFCLKEAEPSSEHIVPYAIGGSLTTNRVCEICNSLLGSNIDARLCNYFSIRASRFRLNLAGQKGSVPNLAGDIFGQTGRIAGTSEKMFSRIDILTGQVDHRIIPRVSEAATPDGKIALNICADIRDLPKILQRERKKAGCSPYSQSEIDAILQNASLQTIVNPEVIYTVDVSLDDTGAILGILKICYELAFTWFGEEYLTDQIAGQLRTACVEASLDESIVCNISAVADCPIFNLWNANKDLHIACGITQNNEIALAIKIFNDLAGMVVVTKNAQKYLGKGNPNDTLRFLAMDPVQRIYQETTMSEEIARIAKLFLNKTSEVQS